jgi:DNA repair exonuclease SbcCD ATPase subunit
MITFKNIRWKNFLSTGNQWTSIDLNTSATTIIVGSNGAGKSTLLDALTFVLFNKPFRKINKPQLVNSVNEKDCLVEITFSVGNKEYFVRRGMKPNIFDVEVDGKKLHKQADERSSQRILEENILKLNYKSFTQIVILGSSTFVPFMQLSASSRREVIEDLLDIKIFSAMNSIVKENLRSIRDSIKVLDIKKESFIDKINLQKNFIEELENRGKQTIDEKKSKLKEIGQQVLELIKTTEILSECLQKRNEEVTTFVNSSKNIRKLGNVRGKIQNKLDSIYNQTKFFEENTVCPTCTQDIEDHFRVNKVEELKQSTTQIHEGLNELDQKIREEEERELRFKELSEDISSLSNEISSNNASISAYHKQCRDLESEIQRITTKLENKNTEHEKLSTFENDLENVYKLIADQKDQFNHYEYINSLLKDGGVKTQIIKKYLPLINKQVNRYLRMMDFYINFKLDEEFNESINSPIHEKFSYSSFSEGEKMRIDIALLFTWREVARARNSVNTNLLIMDEVFDSSLDGVGTDEFLKIIRYIIKDANIFIISHKTDLHDKFQNSIKFDKVRGFSKIIK